MNEESTSILAKQEDILYCFPNEKDGRVSKFSGISDQSLGPICTEES